MAKNVNTTQSDPDLQDPNTRGLTPDEVKQFEKAQIAEAAGVSPEDLQRHELPPHLREPEQPFIRTDSGKTIFTEEQAIAMGLTDAEIVKLRQSGAMPSQGGLFEYDEAAELERLNKLRLQQARINAISDGGDLFAVQLSEMERYFKGFTKNKRGTFCQRHTTTLPEDRVVGINGYVFNIPKFKPVPLPLEVLWILEQSALATNQHSIYSAIMQARLTRPITLEEFMSSPPPESHLARFAQSHPVRMGGDLQPFAGAVTPFMGGR